MENEFKTRGDEVKEALLFLYNHKRKGYNPSWLDYASALNYPIEDVIDAYNELIDEGVFGGEKAYLRHYKGRGIYKDEFNKE